MKARIILLLLSCFLPAALHAQDAERIRDVIYAKHDGVALTMDIFKPVNPNGAAIIKIVSGGWKSSHQGINDGGFPKAGYTTFVVVHGSQPRFQVEEIVADLNRAVRFVRANANKYGVDPQKLGVTGNSAGGHLSLMLATRGGPGDANAADPVDRESSAVQAAACFYPPTDYLNWFADGDNAVGIGRLAAYAGAFGPKAATPEGREKLGRELSPIYWVHKEQPPVFIVHGDADPQVSVTQAQRFFKRSGEVGAKCELLIREGAGHGGWQEMGEDTSRMTEWFDLQLLGKQPAKPFTLAISSAPGTKVASLNELTAAEKAQGWRLLFDGKTTAGWRGYRGKEMPPKWEVVEGALTLMKSSPVGAPGAEGTGIVTMDEFTDFDLRWEWKLADGGNSGVIYRFSEELSKPHETGLEYQLSDALRHPDGKQSPLKWSGACYGMYAPLRDLAKPSNEWNTARILVRGKQVEHWLNGELAAKFEIGNADWQARVQKSKWKDYPRYALETKGRICFQDHSHSVAFRNVKILPLTQQPVAKGRFENEIAAFEAAELAKPSPPGGIVFTGASGIRLWQSLAEDFAGLPVINRGFGGSYTSELTEYADRILIPLKPRVIALQPASNDLVIGKTPEQALADFQAFVAKVREALPDVRIVYLGINPSPKRWEIRGAQQRTNQLIREHILTGKNMAFVDLWDSSLGPEGQPLADFYIADQLHPTRKAYQLRAPIIRPFLEP